MRLSVSSGVTPMFDSVHLTPVASASSRIFFVLSVGALREDSALTKSERDERPD